MKQIVSHQVNRVAKNTTYMTMALVIQKALSFFYYAYIARGLGDVGLGKYTFALAFTSIFVIFMDFGLGPILTREGARDESKIKSYLSNIVSLKIVLIFISLIALFVSLAVINRNGSIPQDTLNLTYLATLIIIFDTLTTTFYTVFRALQNLKFETLGLIIYQTIIVGLGVAALSLGLPIYAIILTILVGSIFNFTWSLSWLIKKAKIIPKISLSKDFAFKLLKMSAPFALAGIFFKLNGSVDTVMLETITEEKFVGWYSVAYKLTFALTVLPGAFATSFYPAMSHYFIHNKEKLAHLFESSMFYLMAISVPIAVGASLLADKVILYLFGPVFVPAAFALQIFMAVLIFVFCNYPVGNMLNACNRQTLNMINMGAALLINVILNVFLIPRYNFVGATIAAAISSVVLIILGLPWIYKIAPFSRKFLLSKLVKILISGAAMGVAIYLLEDILSFFIIIPIAVILYVVALIAVKGFTISQVKGLYRATFTKS